MSSQDTLQTVIAAAPGIQYANLTILSTATWFFWDWIISIDSEIQHFWGKKMNVGWCLYFSNRAVGVITFLLHFYVSFQFQNTPASSEICRPMIYVMLVLSGVGSFIVQTVLVLRTYALWDCHKGIFRLLMTLNVLGSLAQQGVVADIWHGSVATIPWNPLPTPYTGCVIIFNIPPWQKYVPILVFEFVVLLFMVVRFAEYGRQGRSHRVLYVLFRDGFLEFTAVSGISLLTILIAITKDRKAETANIANISFTVVSAISLICCARLLLNIRDVMTLYDPRDTTKPNPWTLTPSFDERFGDIHVPNGPASEHEGSPIEMFDTFFRNSEQATPRQDETVDVVLPRSSDESWRQEGGVDVMAMPSTERRKSRLGLQVSLEDPTPRQLRREGV